MKALSQKNIIIISEVLTGFSSPPGIAVVYISISITVYTCKGEPYR